MDRLEDIVKQMAGNELSSDCDVAGAMRVYLAVKNIVEPVYENRLQNTSSICNVEWVYGTNGEYSGQT